jgi:hypothetical protein
LTAILLILASGSENIFKNEQMRLRGAFAKQILLLKDLLQLIYQTEYFHACSLYCNDHMFESNLKAVTIF